MLSKVATFLFFILSVSLFGNQQVNDTINQIDKQGKKQGYWEKNYPNGKPVYKGYFKDNRPAGTMTRYYESGVVKAIIEFLDDNSFSKVTFYYEDESMAAEGFYMNNEKDSIWNYYSFFDKALKSREKYINSKKNGKSFVYYLNGQVFDEMNWKDNKRHGEWSQYFQNGNAKMITYYENDVLHGCFNVFFDNGNPEIVGRYENNVRNGTWMYYDAEGKLLLELEYDTGRLLNQEKLDRQQQENFKKMDENIGNIREPEPEDFVGH